jgi:hypothetical protein
MKSIALSEIYRVAQTKPAGFFDEFLSRGKVISNWVELSDGDFEYFQKQAQPVVEQPVVEQPVVEQPVVEQPVVEQPVVEQPVVEQPVDYVVEHSKSDRLSVDVLSII